MCAKGRQPKSKESANTSSPFDGSEDEFIQRFTFMQFKLISCNQFVSISRKFMEITFDIQVERIINS